MAKEPHGGLQVAANAMTDKMCWGYIHAWRVERLTYTDWIESVVDESAQTQTHKDAIVYRQALRDYHGITPDDTPETAAQFWVEDSKACPDSFPLDQPTQRKSTQDLRTIASVAEDLMHQGVEDDDAVRVASKGQFATVKAYTDECKRYTNDTRMQDMAKWAVYEVERWGLSMGLQLTNTPKSPEEAIWEWVDPSVTTPNGEKVMEDQAERLKAKS